MTLFVAACRRLIAGCSRFLDEMRNLIADFEMRHVADLRKKMQPDKTGQPERVPGRNYPVVKTKNDFGGNTDIFDEAADRERLRSIGKQRCGEGFLR